MMAERLVFFPKWDNGHFSIKKELISFEFSPGFSITQKQKCIRSLHQRIKELHHNSVPLEISTKSNEPIGVALSAFNLSFRTKLKNEIYSVESTFQGSKIFENGGPYTDIYKYSSKDAKKDPRIKDSGKLVGFSFFNIRFGLKPETGFYDWLYINALMQTDSATQEKIRRYNVFTDIEFNYKKSINCQAHSVALYRCLVEKNLLSKQLKNPEIFFEITNEYYTSSSSSSSINSC